MMMYWMKICLEKIVEHFGASTMLLCTERRSWKNKQRRREKTICLIASSHLHNFQPKVRNRNVKRDILVQFENAERCTMRLIQSTSRIQLRQCPLIVILRYDTMEFVRPQITNSVQWAIAHSVRDCNGA